MKITESKLRRIIREAIVNEISQQAKAGAFVKANNDINRLRQMKNNGQRIFTKNGRLVDVDNELERRGRQMDSFGNGLSHDLSMEYGKDRVAIQHHIDDYKNDINNLKNQIARIESGEIEDYDGAKMVSLKNALNRNIEQYKRLLTNTNGYSVNALGNDGYEINTPAGRVYSNTSNSNMFYDKSNSNTGNLNRLHKLQGITDAMIGYDDELSGKMDKDLGNLKRRQRNVQAIKDYNDAYDRWEHNDNEIKKAQADYDSKPFFKKWFSKRPTDGPQKPTKPDWVRGDDGQFDGYFAHSNPSDYENDINKVSARQQQYKDARKKYFK